MLFSTKANFFILMGAMMGVSRGWVSSSCTNTSASGYTTETQNGECVPTPWYSTHKLTFGGHGVVVFVLVEHDRRCVHRLLWCVVQRGHVIVPIAIVEVLLRPLILLILILVIRSPRLLILQLGANVVTKLQGRVHY